MCLIIDIVSITFLTANATQQFHDHDNLDESGCIYRFVFGVYYPYLAKYGRFKFSIQILYVYIYLYGTMSLFLVINV